MLDVLIDASLEAGELIMQVYGRADFGARSKADGSPVTEADGLAEAAILLRLAHAFPDIPVVAEEAVSAGLAPRVADRFFLVDPLDGTREFLARNGDFTVNIGLIEDGRATVGVIYAPATGELYAGDPSGARQATVTDGAAGAFSPMRVRTPPPGGLTFLSSRSHPSKATAGWLARFPVAETLRAGSSVKFGRLAAGQGDLYARLTAISQWDIAAGEAIVKAAGGAMSDLDGEPILYGPQEGADPWRSSPFVAAGAFDPFAILAP